MTEEKINKQVQVLSSYTDEHCNVHTNYRVFIDEILEEPKQFREVYNLLNSATQYDTIYITINTRGGCCMSAHQMYMSLRSCKAKVIGELFKGSSSGSIIALGCHELLVKPCARMLIHNGTGGTYGKPNDRVIYANAYMEWAKDFFNVVYDKFLTKKEINSVLDGKEMWLNEKEIIERLNK